MLPEPVPLSSLPPLFAPAQRHGQRRPLRMHPGRFRALTPGVGGEAGFGLPDKDAPAWRGPTLPRSRGTPAWPRPQPTDTALVTADASVARPQSADAAPASVDASVARPQPADAAQVMTDAGLATTAAGRRCPGLSGRQPGTTSAGRRGSGHGRRRPGYDRSRPRQPDPSRPHRPGHSPPPPTRNPYRNQPPRPQPTPAGSGTPALTPAHPCQDRQSAAYAPFAATSSSWLPSSLIRPFSTTAMTSASWAVWRR